MERFFDKELDTLRNNLMQMGDKAVRQLENAIAALMTGDLELARKVRRDDDEIDELEIEIDREVIRFMSLRGPVAHDLRLVVVGMKASHDLERVGDEANNIAKRVEKIVASGPPLKDYVDIPRMGELAAEMLRDALESLLQGNATKAMDICKRDKAVDQLNRQLYRELTGFILEDPSKTTHAIELMFVSKSLERIADHATNIAEEVVFLQHGKDIRHQAPEEIEER